MIRRRSALVVGAFGVIIAVAAALYAIRSQPDVSAARGQRLFASQFGPDDGLGPLYNETSCLACHSTPRAGGVGPNSLATVLRVGRLSDDAFDPLVGHGGPVARAHSVAELISSCTMLAGIPAGANVTSVRNAPQLFGLGDIERIPDGVIVEGAVPRADGILGKPNMLNGEVGKFGWKGDEPHLSEFVAAAFHNELGITSPDLPDDVEAPPGCGRAPSGPEVDQSVIEAVTAYITSLPAPSSHPGDRTVFVRTGCAECHVPSLGGVPLYSDLLLHDMGRSLDDAVIQGQAQGKDWRTAPLWGLGQRARFLHDGRAASLEAAILGHGGEAQTASDRFRGLAPGDQQALLEFLRTL